MKNQDTVGKFFDSLSRDYTETIERCFPRYREMLWAALAYLPENREVRSILELGCGTGNLSVLTRERFPEATLELVDLSGESLEVCRSRIREDSALVCREANFAQLDYPDGTFDLVVSSIAIHHLDAPGKRLLFEKIHRWLTNEGVFCFADQCRGATEDLNARHTETWQSISHEAGSDEEEWEMWMRHQSECDFHDTLFDQVEWLRRSGFSVVDCVWRYLLWSVIQARK